ncbi:hypothetical protein STEG23_013574 [Scotinomys teguina]
MEPDVLPQPPARSYEAAKRKASRASRLPHPDAAILCLGQSPPQPKLWFSRHDLIGQVVVDHFFDLADFPRECILWKDIEYVTNVLLNFLCKQSVIYEL